MGPKLKVESDCEPEVKKLKSEPMTPMGRIQKLAKKEPERKETSSTVRSSEGKKDPSQHLPIRNRILNQNPNTMTDTLTDCPPLVIRLMIVRGTSTRRKRKKRIRSEKKRTS